MKKILLIVTVGMFGIFNTNAQERSRGDIEATPYVQYSSSFFNGDNIDLYDPRTSVSLGVKGDYFFNDRWSLRSGINYDSMGTKASDFNSEVALDYIHIPLNANWHFGSTRKWNLNFGLTPGFLIKADQDGTDIKEFVESFQLGISYGIGYKLEISDNFSLLFDLQAIVGVTNLDKEDVSTNLNAGSGLGIGGVFSF